MGNPVGTTFDDELARRGEKAHVLDANHFFHFITGSWSSRADGVVGIILWHRCSDGVRACGGYVAFERGHDDRERPVWEVQSWNPLTLSPSILCNGKHDDCGGTHGWIRDGVWQAA